MRILFVKTSSLGDVVHNCPAVSEAARGVRDASIDWVVEEPFAEIALLHASVRRVIPVAVRRWRAAPLLPRTWSEIAAFRGELRRERYDCVVDSQGLLKSALIAMLARGPKSGLDRASAREPLAAYFYGRRYAVEQALHAVERNCRLAAAALGYARRGACDYGLRAGGEPPLGPRSPFAVLLTMTSRADKLWPEAQWSALGAALAARGVQCVLPWGSEPERLRCERIASAIGGALVPPHMRLSELARLMRHAQWVAGVDTGLSHLAVALGARTLGIYCGSDPALTGLYGSERARNLGGIGKPPAAEEALEALERLA